MLGQRRVALRTVRQLGEALHLPDQVEPGVFGVLLLGRVICQHFAQMQAERAPQGAGPPFEDLAQAQAIALDRCIVTGVLAQLGGDLQARLRLGTGQAKYQHLLHAHRTGGVGRIDRIGRGRQHRPAPSG